MSPHISLCMSAYVSPYVGLYMESYTCSCLGACLGSCMGPMGLYELIVMEEVVEVDKPISAGSCKMWRNVKLVKNEFCR